MDTSDDVPRRVTGFMRTADQWLLAFAVTSFWTLASSVQQGSIVHAVELHLKALHLTLSKDLAATVAFSHRIDDLLAASKALAPGLLEKFNLRRDVIEVLRKDWRLEALPADLQEQFLWHQPLYVTAVLGADAKYLGTPLKAIKSKTIAWGGMQPEPYWIPFFTEIRRFIGYSPEHMGRLIEYARVPQHVAEYARELSGG
jgi:hypothetical protein